MSLAQTYEYETTSLPSIEKFPLADIKKMEEHLQNFSDKNINEDEKNNLKKKIELAKYFNDGIAGAEFLPKIVEDFLEKFRIAIKEKLDINFIISNENIDLGSVRRMWNHSQAANDNMYQGLDRTVKDRGWILKKNPTTTIKREQLEELMHHFPKFFEFLETSEITREEYIELQCKSPNAFIRKLLWYNVLIRPFTHADYQKPNLTKNLHLFTPKLSTDLFVSNDNKIIKKLDYKSLDILADNIFNRAKRIWKKTIFIATKNTISKFDAEFVGYLKNKLKEKIIEELKREKAKSLGVPVDEVIFKEEKIEVLIKDAGWKIEDPLFDSFLPTLINWKYNDEIVVCPPDQAEMLDFLDQVDRDKIPENVDNSKIKDVKVFRVSTGSGYGEKMKKNSDGTFEETYTLNDKDVEVSARRAWKEAKDKWEKLIVVAASSEKNVVDTEFQKMVLRVVPKEDFVVKSISDIMRDKIMYPTNNDTVFLTANNTWDYLTDFFQQFFYGKLGKASLWVGYEIAIAEDDEGNIVSTMVAPSTGTAPDIDHIDQVNPAGALLWVVESVLMDPKAPAAVKNAMRWVHESIFEVLKGVSNGNYNWFNDRVIAETFWDNDSNENQAVANVA